MAELRRIKLTVAYDGTNYCGWQHQPNALAVEEVLNKAVSDLLGKNTEVTGASRTDSGVHALGNVAVFDTDSMIPGEKFCYALNQRLPDDIVVVDSIEVPLDFHPRFTTTRKVYEYVIYNYKHPDPLRRRYTHFCFHDLDVELMRKGAKYLVGKHDFASFCSAKSQSETTTRTIESITIDQKGKEITIRVTGDGFLYNMIRMIAGVLMRVGTKFYPPEEVKNILEQEERGFARPTAPACGLTLVSIEYPEWEMKKDEEVRELS